MTPRRLLGRTNIVEIPSHVRAVIEGACSDCGNDATDLHMDRRQPRFRCAPCAVKAAQQELEGAVA